MNAEVNRVWPVVLNQAKIRSVPPPVSPPNKKMAMGVPIKGATTARIRPVTTAVLKSNLNRFAIKPATNATAMFTRAKGISMGLTKTPLTRFVSAPVIAPANGPRVTALKIVPTVSRKINGMASDFTARLKIMLIRVPVTINVIFFVLFILVSILQTAT